MLVQILSPRALKSGLDSPNTVNIRPYVKMDNIQFAGLSYRVTVQMDLGDTPGEAKCDISGGTSYSEALQSPRMQTTEASDGSVRVFLQRFETLTRVIVNSNLEFDRTFNQTEGVK